MPMSVLEKRQSSLLSQVSKILTPASFAYYASGCTWKPAAHHLLISQHLVDVVAGRIRRLIITMPPRHGKSELVSHYFVAWYLGIFRHLNRKIVQASYNSDFASEWTGKVRDTLAATGATSFGVDVDEKGAKSELRLVPYQTSTFATGIRSSLTGRGADILIIDDPIKDDMEARSVNIRNRTWDWYRSTARTRLSPIHGAIILIQTRWHMDDLAGRILRAAEPEDKFPWTVLSFPAIATSDDVLGRTPGDPLWPTGGWGLENLGSLRKDLGSYLWNALYQQTPIADEGAIFDPNAFRYYLEDDEHFEIGGEMYDKEAISLGTYITIDVAYKVSEQHDYTAACVFEYIGNRRMLVRKVYRERYQFRGKRDFVLRLYEQWNPTLIFIEDPDLVDICLEMGIPTRQLIPKGSKVDRAIPAGELIRTGHVMFPKTTEQWWYDFQDELIQFPVGAFDDQVDALSYAVQLTRGMLGRSVIF